MRASKSIRYGAAFGVLAAICSADAALAQLPERSSCAAGRVLVAGGTFHVGTSTFQAFDVDEQPRRAVTLSSSFCIDRTEVTVDDYAACVRAGSCAAVAPAFVGEGMPMTNVDWNDARRYCAFVGGRLPTEAQWERAARGSDDRLYPWGDGQPTCARADVWIDGEGACHGYGPSRVGSLPAGASPWGALDMAGNVLEWVDDAYLDDAWSVVSDVDPRIDVPSAARHSVRGGSWEYDVVHSPRVSARDGYPTELRDDALGFRCAYEGGAGASAGASRSIKRAPSDKTAAR